MTREPEKATARVTVLLGEPERRALLARAAERSLTEHRPVSMSETMREIVRRGLEVTPERAA